MAPLFILSTLLLSGCAGNVIELARVSRDAALTLGTAAAPELGETLAAYEADAQLADELSAQVAQQGVDDAVAVQMIDLGRPLSSPEAEISGMAWYGDRLILMPQYPSVYGDTIFALSKAEIAAALRGETEGPLRPTPIAFDDGALYALIDGFDGFEAITFDGDRAYLTIESRSPLGMLGLLVTGTMSADGSYLSLDPFTQASIPAQSALTNMTDESITRLGDLLVTFYEANGVNVNPQAQAHLFNLDLDSLGTVPLPAIEFRVTDATETDALGRFWVINYMWPGDSDKLRPGPDMINGGAESDGRVERLVELQFTEEGIELAGTPPLNLQLLPGGISRNWEGLVRFNEEEFNGFLLATDKFPTTMLGFVPLAEADE
jgi:hypothetical protein